MVEISVLYHQGVDTVRGAIGVYAKNRNLKLALDQDITSLILHGNSLLSLDGAASLPNLELINASANTIESLDPASDLPPSLKKLNLATNSIRTVEFRADASSSPCIPQPRL